MIGIDVKKTCIEEKAYLGDGGGSSRDKKNFENTIRGTSMAKIPSFQCKRWGFDPWSGNEDPTCHAAWPKKKNAIQV